MTVRLGIMIVLQFPFPKRSLEPRQFTLAPGAASCMSIQPNGQIVRILSGHSWISFDGKDILLEPGQQLLLPRHRYPAIISAIGLAALTFESSRNCGT